MLMMGFVALIFFLLPLLSYMGGLFFFGFPLDFYLIAQGLVLLFIGAVFWFSLRQEHMDRVHRMSEDL
ncbi:MAG: sodium/substrate symporter small subunit [Methyloligellaceae bacterium]